MLKWLKRFSVRLNIVSASDRDVSQVFTSVREIPVPNRIRLSLGPFAKQTQPFLTSGGEADANNPRNLTNYHETQIPKLNWCCFVWVRGSFAWLRPRRAA